MNNRLFIFLLTSFLLAGCVEAMQVIIALDGVAPNEDYVLSFYCDEDQVIEVKASERKAFDKKNSWREVCGWDDVEFVPATDRHFHPNRYDRIYVYNRVLHRPGQKDVVVNDAYIQDEYLVLGEFHFPQRWYHMRTVEDYLRQAAGKLGGDAVSKFDAYIVSGDDGTGNPLAKGYVMRVDATIIRYLDVSE